MQAIAQLASALCFDQQSGELRECLHQACAHRFTTQGVDGFIGKIDGRFHMHAQARQLAGKCIHALRENAFQ